MEITRFAEGDKVVRLTDFVDGTDDVIVTLGVGVHIGLTGQEVRDGHDWLNISEGEGACALLVLRRHVAVAKAKGDVEVVSRHMIPCVEP